MNKIKAFFLSIKQGFADINLVAADGKAKILLRPIIVMGVLAYGAYYVSDKFEVQKSEIEGKISSQRMQKSKIAGYDGLKASVSRLEEGFPDVKLKTEWLFGLVIDIFREQGIGYEFGGGQKEESNDVFTVTTLPVKFTTSYSKLGALCAAIENSGKFVRITDLKVDKSTSELGLVNVEMNLSTAFLKEKSF